MSNDLPSGIPLAFEQFAVLAELEPAEIGRLALLAGTGERPLRGWIQLMANQLGVRIPREPLRDPLAPDGTPIPGLDGVGIEAGGIDDRGHLLVTLSDGRVLDAGLVRPQGFNTPGGVMSLVKTDDGYFQLRLVGGA